MIQQSAALSNLTSGSLTRLVAFHKHVGLRPNSFPIIVRPLVVGFSKTQKLAERQSEIFGMYIMREASLGGTYTE